MLLFQGIVLAGLVIGFFCAVAGSTLDGYFGKRRRNPIASERLKLDRIEAKDRGPLMEAKIKLLDEQLELCDRRAEICRLMCGFGIALMIVMVPFLFFVGKDSP